MDESSERQRFKQRVGDAIRRARMARGLTQVVLADLCGLRGATISDYERGANLPDAGTLWTMADRLAVTIDDLVGRAVPEGADIPGLIAPFMLDPDGGTESLVPAVQAIQKSLELSIGEIGKLRERVSRLESGAQSGTGPRSKGD